MVYGSSIAHGVGASRSGMSYVAILGRSLNLDVVNLAFSGAGKAEPEVVELVSMVDACCLILDLGKSYGYQSVERYVAMLKRVRSSGREASIVCIAPVFAPRELHSAEYGALSHHTRSVVRRAAMDRVNAGDANVVLVEGTELLGPDDSDGFAADGVHPSDLGHWRIARRLRDTVSPLVARR